MKQIFFVFISIINFTLCNAQFTPSSRINTPFGSAIIPGHYNTNFFNFSPKNFETAKHDFLIELVNGEVLEVKTKIQFRDSTSFLKWKQNGETKILLPHETKSIYHSSYKRNIFKGIPIKNAWVFQVDSAKINTFTITSDFIKSTPITHIQKHGNAEILPLTKENLVEMVADNPRALVLAKKNKLYKAIKAYNQ